jgi:hypothetical protein
VADVDRAGVRIAVNKGSAYDLYLTRTLKHATLQRGDDGIQLFKQEKLEAAGGVRQPLAEYAKTDPSVRVMDTRFMAIEQAMGMPKGRAKAHAYLNAFVEEMKSSGFCADALKRANQPDALTARRNDCGGVLLLRAERRGGRAAAAVGGLVAGHRFVFVVLLRLFLFLGLTLLTFGHG